MRSCLLLGCFGATNCFSLDHKFSIGFKSGLFPGNCSSFTPCDWNQFKHYPAVWHGAPSCWTMYCPLSPNRSHAYECIYMNALEFIPTNSFVLVCAHPNTADIFFSYRARAFAICLETSNKFVRRIFMFTL